MCLTPGKGATTDGGGVGGAPAATGPGPDQTEGNALGPVPADSGASSPSSSPSHHNGESPTTNTTQVTTTSPPSKTINSLTNSTSLSVKVAATVSTPTTAGDRKSSLTTSTASGAPTLKLKGSLTSSLASKFGGNTAVFPKLGVGGLTSPKIGGGGISSKKFEANSSSTSSSSKVEFAAIKLKKVSKITSSGSSSSSTTSTTEDKAKTIEEKKTDDTASLAKISETVAGKKSSVVVSSKGTTDSQSSDSIKSDVTSAAAEDSKKSIETDSRPLQLSTKSPSDLSGKSSKVSSIQSEKTKSSETLKSLSSTKNISQSSCKSSTESLSSSSVKSVNESTSSVATSVFSSSSSSSSSYHSSSTKTVITSSSISSSTSVSSSSSVSNALSRSTTIKNSDIPAIASKTLIVLNNAGEEQSGDTEIKVTHVKKVKKSSGLSVKKKKYKVTGRDSEGKEIPIIEEGAIESPPTGSTDLHKQGIKDCAIEIKVNSTTAATKENETKNLSKTALVNGVTEDVTKRDSKSPSLKPDKKSGTESVTKTVTVAASSDTKTKSYGKASTDNITQGNDEIIVLKRGKKDCKGTPVVIKVDAMAVPSPAVGTGSVTTSSETTSAAVPVLPSPKSPGKSSEATSITGAGGLTASPLETASDLQTSLASLSLDSGVSSSASVGDAGTSASEDGTKTTDPLQQGETTAAISIPNCAAVPSSLSSSPSVCSLSTATDTLSTSISTSTSDLSISPPASMPPCTNLNTSGGGVAAASILSSTIMSTSTTTLSSTSTNLPSSCITTSTTASASALPSAVDAGCSAAAASTDGSGSGVGEATCGDRSTSGGGRSVSDGFLPSTLFTSDEPVTVIVRDMSSITMSINRTNIYAQGSSTVRSLLVEVGHRFGYEPDSFSLTMQNTRTADTVELERLDPYTTLEAAGFIADGVSRNSLLLSDLRGTAPKKAGADTSTGSRDDDLALGASASPTSCGGGEYSGMYSSTSTTGASSRHKKHVWPDLDLSTSSSGAGATATTSSSAHEYTNYTYGCGASKQDTGYVGLVNQAMTCYLNSLLQTLYMTPEFRNALYRWEFKLSPEEGAKSIPFQLQKLFLLLQTTDRSAVETTRLTRSFGWDSSEAWQQHDIQELCRVMFEALEQSFANTDQANLIDTLYQGKMKDYVKCLACGNENARMDSFLDIPLPIRPFGSSTAYQSLEEALKAFVTPELLSGTNQYRCSNCDSMCDAHKGLKFTRYPYLLTIHLKRFDFDYQTFHRIKLNDRVTFPNQLDLSEFLDVLSKDDNAMSPTTDAVPTTSSTSPGGGGGGVCSSNKSDSAASSGGPLDDTATDDSGSALDNEDSSLVDYTPPHNTTQEEDEGIDLTTASDTERGPNDKMGGKVAKKSGVTKVEKPAKADSSPGGSKSKDSPLDNSSTDVTSQDTVDTASKNIDGNTTTANEKDAESSKKASNAEVNSDDVRQDERYTTYQLFSIMIHSGSASGGHYYAYIKDFVTEDWFCFNDQSVTRISDDDIKRTYGSGARGITGYAASANAYMLMYRQINDKMNVLPFDKDNFPDHVKKLSNSLVVEEEQEREARERERCTCVIKLYCHHPTTAHLSDLKLRVHKDATFAEATRQAHQLLELYKSVPIERCRLVKYEEYQDSLESSFEDQDDKPMSEVLGGVKSSYKFDLLMEVREENQKFEVYRPGGLSVKVYVVSLSGCGEVEGPHIIRGTLTMTVTELKQAIGRSLNLNSETMRIVAEGFYNEMKLLGDDTLQLGTEGLYRSSKVFVEASGEESNNFFSGSQMASVIDRYQNTITLYCNLPDVSPAILSDLKIPPYCEEAVTPPQPRPAHTTETTAESIADSVSTSHDGGTPTAPAAASDAEGTIDVTAPASGTADAAVTAVTSDTATTGVTTAQSPVVTSVTDTSTNVVGSSPLPPSHPPTTPTTITSTGDTAACSSSSTSYNNSSVPVFAGTSSAITNVNSNNSLSTNNTSSNSSNNNISLSSQKQNLTLPVPSTSVLNSPSSLSSSSTNSSSALATGSSSSEAPVSSDASSASGANHCNLVIVGTSIPAPSPGGQATPGDGGGGSSGGGGANLSDGEDDDGACGGGYSTLSSDQSTSEDSSLTSDSDRTLVGDPPEDDRLSDRCNSPDYHNVSSPEEPSAKAGGSSWSAGIACDDDDVIGGRTTATAATGDVSGTDLWAASANDPPWNNGETEPPAVKRYFKAKMLVGSDNPDERVLEMRVDNRMTVDQLKAAMQPHVGVPLEHFKLYKKYTQEFECSRGGEMVKNFGECGRLVAKLDRALQEGEYRGKVYLLDIHNTTEPGKYLIDFVLRENDKLSDVKAAIVKEVNSSCQLSLTVDRVRLRRKSWKNPQTVYLDHQMFGERDITLHNNWELFIQEREPPELKTNCSDDQLVLFTRRWRPSQYSLDPIVELLVPDNTGQDLRQKLSEASGIPADNIQVGKGRNTFPHEVSVLDISAELEWTRAEGPLDARPLNILDDGAMVYYRDKEERLKELTDSERSDLESEENKRLNRELPYAAALPAARPAREKGLKIYFNTE